VKVLILCTGNSCRSQMAHRFMQSFDKRIDVFSAGTSPGEHINKTGVTAMNKVGIDISMHRPKSVDIYLHEYWDYVITVCDNANETCPVFSQAK
jgi:arsenate reductase (thioredoxin)